LNKLYFPVFYSGQLIGSKDNKQQWLMPYEQISYTHTNDINNSH